MVKPRFAHTQVMTPTSPSAHARVGVTPPMVQKTKAGGGKSPNGSMPSSAPTAAIAKPRR